MTIYEKSEIRTGIFMEKDCPIVVEQVERRPATASPNCPTSNASWNACARSSRSSRSSSGNANEYYRPRSCDAIEVANSDAATSRSAQPCEDTPVRSSRPHDMMMEGYCSTDDLDLDRCKFRPYAFGYPLRSQRLPAASVQTRTQIRSRGQSTIWNTTTLAICASGARSLIRWRNGWVRSASVRPSSTTKSRMPTVHNFLRAHHAGRTDGDFVDRYSAQSACIGDGSQSGISRRRKLSNC